MEFPQFLRVGNSWNQGGYQCDSILYWGRDTFHLEPREGDLGTNEHTLHILIP
jgi:hypothetical protein